MQSVLTVNRKQPVKWIFMKHICVLYDYLSENFVRYRSVHLKTAEEFVKKMNYHTISSAGNVAILTAL